MNISILALGLIGGSLGLALRESSINAVVTGWHRTPTTITTALERGAIDHGALTLPEAVRDADVVVIATPVTVIRAILAEIAPHLKPGAIVTDVGSTKAQIMAWAEELLPTTVTCIGGHPMAGSEQHGIQHARADLFRNAVYCLTPDARATPEAIGTLESLAIEIGARPLCLSAADHDASVAAVSHLPFILSTALAQLTTQDPRWPEMSVVAATGYRDTTRLASGDPVMHRDICLTNAEAIRPWLRSMAGFLDDLADRLDDAAALQTFFDSAKQGRDAWLRERQLRQALAEERRPTQTIVPDPALTI